MKKIYIGLAAVLILIGAMLLNTNVSSAKKPEACTTIQDGVLTYSATHYLNPNPLKIGYDEYGYNYQAHMFKGSYANVYLGSDGFPPYKGDDNAYAQRLTDEGLSNPDNKWYWPYRNVDLLMKWNNAWLANTDCDGDGLLDRHYEFTSYIGSGAWETNHMKGGEGKDSWTYFTKIVAAPADATLNSGVWYNAEGIEIGPSIWGEFATIMEVESGLGATYISPAGPGFGKY